MASVTASLSPSGHGTALFTVVNDGSESSCSASGPSFATHSSMTAAPMAPSLQYWWRAKISPPFSSPPKAAPVDAISRATIGEPTAV